MGSAGGKHKSVDPWSMGKRSVSAEGAQSFCGRHTVSWNIGHWPESADISRDKAALPLVAQGMPAEDQRQLC